MKSSQQYAVLPIIALSLSAVVLSACNGSSNDTTDTADSGGQTPPENKVSLLVAADGGDETGLISRYDASIQPATGLGSAVQTFAAGLAEGIATDHADHLYQAGIDGFGTVKAVCHLPKRASGSVFDVGIDRVVTSALNSPKGITVAQKAGLIMTAETGAPAAAVSVVSATAGEGSMPLYTISRTAMGGSGAWDVAYDEDSDKLFVALTNGSVAYFKGYLALAMTGAEVEPTAIFRPNNPLPASNMHGIVYDAASDRLIVSDVGSATSADDGSLYVFEGASGLSGAVAPERTLRGAATLLGNPVDLSMQNGALFVAEKANGGGRILVFLDIAGGGSGDIAPDRVYDLAAPESLMASAATGNATVVTPALSRLLVSANAANMGTQVTAVSPALDTKGNVFTPVMTSQFVESIALDNNGDALVSFDDAGSPGTGGISFVNRLATRAADDMLSVNRDRQVMGASTTLIAPKGMKVVDSAGVALVADLNAAAPGAVKVFSLCSAGDHTPLMTTTLPAGARPWDVDYDAGADRLYVAATNGSILVYDNYLGSMPTAPSRTIDPDDKSGFAVSNLHGIVYDTKTDRLIVSDVGDAANATDGRIYIIDNAAKANGLTALRLEISGPLSQLGNPVDLAFDGANLYVAEKSNNQLQRINGIYNLSGAIDKAADVALSFTAPESIALSY